MLELKDLTKQFRTNNGTTITVLNDIDAKFDDGEFASIIGKSGTGKSTLLSLMGGLDSPTDGEVLIDGRSVGAMSNVDLANYRCHEVGFVFQNYQLIPNLTALENVCLPMEFAGIPRATRIDRANTLLQSVEIDPSQFQSRPGKMSGGEQQRVSIARALANKPSVILADEPTGNLDEATGQMIFDLLRSLSKTENVTIVVVTHDLDIAKKTDRTYRLRKGKLVKE